MGTHTYYWAAHAPIGDSDAKATLEFGGLLEHVPRIDSITPKMNVNCKLEIRYAPNGQPFISVSAVEGEGHAYFAVKLSDDGSTVPAPQVSIQGTICSTWLKYNENDEKLFSSAKPSCRTDRTDIYSPGRCDPNQ